MSTQEKNPDSPATTSIAHDIMKPFIARISAVLGGTETMRAAGEELLPPHEAESEDRYRERLAVTTLLNMAELTLDGLVGKVFSKPLVIEEETTEQMAQWMKDVDLQGNNIQVFAREWFSDGLAKGLSSVFIDFPRPIPELQEDGTAKERSLADDLRDSLRPCMKIIPPESIIFARAERINGRETLLEIRISETVIRMNGFAEELIPQIRQILPGEIRLYRQSEIEKDPSGEPKWILFQVIPYDLKVIPLVTFYANRKGLMISRPPLIDLVDLNITHWQSSSDQRSILTVARFPILAVSGGSDDDNKIRIGPYKSLWCPDPQGKWYYVEHDGAAIEAGRNDLLDLENQMMAYGAQFLRKRPGNETATARALDSAESTTPLQDIALRFQDALNQTIQLMAEWVKVEEPGGVKVNTEFTSTDPDSDAAKFLIELRKGRDISRAKLIEEAKTKGLLDEEFDMESNDRELEKELAEFAPPSIEIDPENDDSPENDG